MNDGSDVIRSGRGGSRSGAGRKAVPGSRSDVRRQRRVARADLRCVECGSPILTGNGTKFCGRECAVSAAARSSVGPLPPISCAWSKCGAVFTPKYRSQRCCSEAHGKLAWVESNPEQVREQSSQRRARERSAFVAPVDRVAIVDRDAWICHLCGKRIPKNVAIPHQLAATIDHVIPLAAHGTHEPANVRAAHWICNTRKGSRSLGPEQLMLIG